MKFYNRAFWFQPDTYNQDTRSEVAVQNQEINIRELCGPICISPDTGSSLCWEIGSRLNTGVTVVLNFEGVEVLTPAFLNSAVSCLHAQYAPEDLSQRLRWEGLDADDSAMMQLVCKNAVQFFSGSDEDRQSIVDAVARPLYACH